MAREILFFEMGRSSFGRACFLLSLVSHAVVKQTLRSDPVSHIKFKSPSCFFGGKSKCTALILHTTRGFWFLYIAEGQDAETFLHAKNIPVRPEPHQVYHSLAQCVPTVAHSLDDMVLQDRTRDSGKNPVTWHHFSVQRPVINRGHVNL